MVLLNIGLQFYRSAHARSTVAYLIANMFAALIPFLLLPLLTRSMSPESYGQYSLFLLAVSVWMPLVSLMLNTVISREYAIRDSQRFAQFFTSCAALSVGVVIILLLACVIFQDKIETATHLPLLWLLLAMVCAISQGALTSMQGIATMQKKPRVYAFWRMGFALMTGLAVYISVVSYQGAWKPLVISQVLVAVLLLAIICWVAVKNNWLIGRIHYPDIKMALVYSVPLVIHAITAGVILQGADRFFVSHYLGIAEAGSYNVAQQVSLSMFVIVNAISLTWHPWYYEQMRKNHIDSHRRIVKMTYAGFAAIALLGVIVSIAMWFLFPYFIGRDYQEARFIFPLLILGFVFNGMYVLVASGMFYSGHTFQLMCCNILTAAINIILNMSLVPLYGMYGAASATLLSTFCMFCMVWAVTAHLHRLPWFFAYASAASNS